MGIYCAIDYFETNSGYIHTYLGGDYFYKNNFDLDTFMKYEIYWFCDNIPEEIYYIFYNFLKEKIIINSPMLRKWELNRKVGLERFKDIFKDDNNFYITKYYYFDKLDDIDEVLNKVKDIEVGVIKSNTSLNKVSTVKYNNFDELKNLLINNKKDYEKGFIIQEYIEGKEVAISAFLWDSEVILPVYVNYEFKRSINKEIGNNTGQSAEFGYFTYAKEPVNIIKKISEYLKKNKIRYTGYLDINGAIKDNKFIPFEWTISRDGYPSIMNFLVEVDITKLFKEQKLEIERPFRYNLILRIDDTETKKDKENMFFIDKNNYPFNQPFVYFFPEKSSKFYKKEEDKIYYKNLDMDNLGLFIKTSDKFEELNPEFNLGVNVMYYIDYDKEVKERYIKEWFKWKK